MPTEAWKVARNLSEWVRIVDLSMCLSLKAMSDGLVQWATNARLMTAALHTRFNRRSKSQPHPYIAL